MPRPVLLLAILAILAILAAVACLPAAASACSLCTEARTRIAFPFISAVMGLPYLWAIAAVGIRLSQRGVAPAERLPARRAIGRVLALVLLGTFALAIPVGVQLASGITTGGWLLYLFWTLVHGSRAHPRRVVALHAVFLAATLGLGARAELTPRSPDALVRLAGYPVDAVYEQVLPELIDRGSDAVPALVKAVRMDGRGGRRAESALFCLGRICDPAAREHLGRLVRERVHRGEASEAAERHAIWAHARCAREEAVADLVELYARAPERERWAVLAGLVQTGSAEGVRFALDRLDVLLAEADRGVSPAGATSRAVITALVDRAGAEDLRDLRLARSGIRVGLEISSADDLRPEFYWTEASRGALPDHDELRERWRREASTIRAAWQ